MRLRTQRHRTIPENAESLLREVHPAQEVLEARVGAEGVKISRLL